MVLEAANLALAAYMAGVIWVVQVVHYPLFARVGRERWTAYEAAHQRRITVVVGPPMLAQPLVGLGVLLARPGVLAATNLALCLAMLVGTLVALAPLHDRLRARWDPAVHARLVRRNGWRAAGWSAQAAVAVALVTTG